VKAQVLRIAAGCDRFIRLRGARQSDGTDIALQHMRNAILAACAPAV